MDTIDKWLKSLRLHKYTHLFRNLPYEEMLNLNEDYLIGKEVTKGARNKMLVSIKKLNLRQERLANMMDDLNEDNISMKEALTVLKDILVTPIPHPKSAPVLASQLSASPPSSASSSSSLTSASSSTSSPYNLTYLFIETLEKVAQRLIESVFIEDNSCCHGIMAAIVDECLKHNSFTKEQKAKVASFKQQMAKTAGNNMGSFQSVACFNGIGGSAGSCSSSIISNGSSSNGGGSSSSILVNNISNKNFKHHSNASSNANAANHHNHHHHHHQLHHHQQQQLLQQQHQSLHHHHHHHQLHHQQYPLRLKQIYNYRNSKSNLSGCSIISSGGKSDSSGGGGDCFDYYDSQANSNYYNFSKNGSNSGIGIGSHNLLASQKSCIGSTNSVPLLAPFSTVNNNDHSKHKQHQLQSIGGGTTFKEYSLLKPAVTFELPCLRRASAGKRIKLSFLSSTTVAASGSLSNAAA